MVYFRLEPKELYKIEGHSDQRQVEVSREGGKSYKLTWKKIVEMSGSNRCPSIRFIDEIYVQERER